MNPTTSQLLDNADVSVGAQPTRNVGSLTIGSALPQQTASVAQGVPQTSNPMAQPASDRGNWFTKALPTIGGVLGGLVSLPAEALDLVSGVGGTALNIAGAGAGAALGQKLENALTGTQGSTIGAGVSGTLGQIAGGTVGKLASGALKIGGNLAGAGADQFVAGQASKGLIGKDLAQDLRVNHGITNIGNQGAKIAGIITGSSDSAPGQALVNKVVENGIFKNGPQRIDLADLTARKLTGKTASVAQGQAQSSGNLAESFMEQNALIPEQRNAIRAQLGAISDAQGKTISGATDSSGALNFLRRVNSLADEERQAYLKSGYTDTEAKNMMKTYEQIGNEVNDRIFSPGGQSVAVSQAEKDALIKDIQTHVAPVNQKAALAITNDVKNSNTYSDLRKLQAKWVTVNQAVQKTSDLAAKNYGTSAGDFMRAGLPMIGALTGGPKGAIAGAGLAAASALNPLEAAGAGILTKAQKAATGKVSQDILPALSRAAGVAGATGINMATQPSASTQVGVGGTQQQQGVNMGNQQDQSLASNPFLSLTGQAPSVLQPIAMQALLGMFAPSLMNQGTTTAAANASQQVQKAQQAGAQLQALMQQYNQGGGAQGGILGTLAPIKAAITGGPAGSYGANANQVLQQISQATGVPANQLTAPQLSQNQAAAGNTVQQLVALLNASGANVGAQPTMAR